MLTNRIFVSRPDSESLRGNLYNGGFVFQYAAHAQALLQLSVSARLLPKVSQKNKVSLTAALV